MNIILFDGICNLCSGIVLFIIKRDKKALFRFAAIQTEAGQTLLRQYNVQDEQNITLYYIREGVCYQKSTAVLYILKDLGGAWKCLFPSILIPSCIRDIFYLFISRNRYKFFGKKESCMMPTKEIKERFID